MKNYIKINDAYLQEKLYGGMTLKRLEQEQKQLAQEIVALDEMAHKDDMFCDYVCNLEHKLTLVEAQIKKILGC